MAEPKKLTPIEIEAIVSAMILAIQLLSNYIGDDTALTEEEKVAFINRIKLAQLSVPEWK